MPVPLPEPPPEPVPLAEERPAEVFPVATSFEQVVLPERTAFRVLLQQWGRTFGTTTVAPCTRVKALGLNCTLEVGTVANLRYFDYRRWLRVTRANGRREFAVLTGLTDSEATLALETGKMRLPVAVLEQEWTGNYTLVWQPPPGGAVLIAEGASDANIQWLRRTLAQVPNLPPRAEIANAGSLFDAELTETVKAFQRLRGLHPDGVVGVRTLIQLSQAAGLSGIPRLTAPAVNGGTQP